MRHSKIIYRLLLIEIMKTKITTDSEKLRVNEDITMK